MAHPGGRPPLWTCKEELEEKINKYLQYVEEKRVMPTLEMLAYYLDCDRITVRSYGKKEEFYSTIKRVKDYIVARQNEALTGGKGSCPGLIFSLCNNVAEEYSQKQEVKTVSESKISISLPKEDEEEAEDA